MNMANGSTAIGQRSLGDPSLLYPLDPPLLRGCPRTSSEEMQYPLEIDYDYAAVEWMVNQFPGIGDEHDVLIQLVGECDDSWLNDVAGRHVHGDNVLEALHTASSGPVAEGSVGGGTGWRLGRGSGRMERNSAKRFRG